METVGQDETACLSLDRLTFSSFSRQRSLRPGCCRTSLFVCYYSQKNCMTCIICLCKHFLFLEGNLLFMFSMAVHAIL